MKNISSIVYTWSKNMPIYLRNINITILSKHVNVDVPYIFFFLLFLIIYFKQNTSLKSCILNNKLRINFRMCLWSLWWDYAFIIGSHINGFPYFFLSRSAVGLLWWPCASSSSTIATICMSWCITQEVTVSGEQPG